MVAGEGTGKSGGRARPVRSRCWSNPATARARDSGAGVAVLALRARLRGRSPSACQRPRIPDSGSAHSSCPVTCSSTRIGSDGTLQPCFSGSHPKTRIIVSRSRRSSISRPVACGWRSRIPARATRRSGAARSRRTCPVIGCETALGAGYLYRPRCGTLGQLVQLRHRLALCDPLGAEGDVDAPAEPLGDLLHHRRDSRVDRAAQHEQLTVAELVGDRSDRARHRLDVGFRCWPIGVPTTTITA